MKTRIHGVICQTFHQDAINTPHIYTHTESSCILNNMLDTTKSPEGVGDFKPNLTCSDKAFLLTTK